MLGLVSHVSASGSALGVLALVPDLKLKHPALPCASFCGKQCRDVRPWLLTLERKNSWLVFPLISGPEASCLIREHAVVVANAKLQTIYCLQMLDL